MYEAIVALVVTVLFVALLFALATPRSASADEGEGLAATSAILLFFFVILFLSTLAGGLWIQPFGPQIGNVAWLPFVFVGLFVALLLAATETARPRDVTNAPTGEGDKLVAEARFALGVFFWILTVALLVAIGFGYWY